MKTLLVLAVFGVYVTTSLSSLLCRDGRFQCPGYICLNNGQLCDGTGDCFWNEDESYEYARCGACPQRDLAAAKAAGQECRKPCTSDFQCKRRKRCRCDGHCGMSCFNPNGGCSEPPPRAHRSTGSAVYRFVDHGVVRVTGDFMFDDFVEFTCPAGMIAVGPQIRCSSHRTWTQAEVHCAANCRRDPSSVELYNLTCGRDCVIDGDCDVTERCICDGPCGRKCVDPHVNCSAAPVTPHTRVEYTGAGFHQIANYLCDTGYYLSSGDASHKCSGSGQWYGDPTICEEIFCGDPTRQLARRNLVLISGGSDVYPVNSVVGFRCNPGYVLTGAANRTCMENGQWSGLMTACQRLGQQRKCPDPGIPAHGGRIGDDFDESREVTFFCHPNYNMVGEATQVCLWALEWSDGGAPLCVDPRYPDRVSDSLRKLAGSVATLPQQGLGRSISTTDNKRHEIAFVFDASKSIKNVEFSFAIAFAKNLVNRLSNYKQASINYGILVFASNYTSMISLHEDEQDTQTVLAKLDECQRNQESQEFTTQLRANTATNKALQELTRQLGLSHPGDNEVERHVFLFTDGKHNEGDDPIDTRNDMLLQYKHLEIYVVTACRSCKNLDRKAREAESGMRKLASKPENFIRIENYYLLNSYLDEVANFTTDLTKCGQAGGSGSIFHQKGSGRVIRGRKAKRTWPWQAAIMIYQDKTLFQTFKEIFAGGSLINQQWVLTAAHIFDDYKNIERLTSRLAVAVGIFERPHNERKRLNPTMKVFQPRKIYVHPGFDRNDRVDRENFNNDVALIRVGTALRTIRDGNVLTLSPIKPEFNGTIPLSPYVRPVCLPCSDNCVPVDKYMHPDGSQLIEENDSEDIKCRKKGKWLADRYVEESRKSMIVTGFGRYSLKLNLSVPIPFRLKEATLHIQPDSICNKTINNIIGNTTRYTDTMFCARSPTDAIEVSDTCQGDSGGPLMREYKHPNTGESCWVQVGIVSFGESCGKADKNGTGIPAFYTDVSAVQSWIESTMNDNP